MENVESNASNKLYIVLAIITFLLSWIPNIEEFYKLLLLFASIILLTIIYFSPYFKITNKIEEKMEKLEEKMEKMEDLINIKSDINLLKEAVFRK